MKIEEVVLATASLSRTRLFYSRTLELPIVAEGEGSVTFAAGNSLLTFNEVKGEKPYYHIAFNITNNRFSDAFDWVNSKLDILKAGEQVPIAVYEDWNAQSFYFYDNNGSILEFIVRFDLPYASAEPFSAGDVREISEIGIACEDVSATSSLLSTQLDAPVFAKTAPTEAFTVLGDNDGLLVLVPEGHHWIPTHKPARKFPLTLTCNGKSVQVQ